MEERFSSYLSEIGLLNETDSSSIIKKDDKASNKSFQDTSFECLKNYFDNLDEEQKKYMSLYIPTKYIKISEKVKKTKLKSIIIQLVLRNKNFLLKYFLLWKNNIIILKALCNYNYNTNNMSQSGNKNEINERDNSDLNSGENLFNNIANKYLGEQNKNNNINIDELKDNVSAYNIVNIDKNVDVDNKHITNSEEEERIKNNKSNENYESNPISFGNKKMNIKNNSIDENENDNFNKYINPKNTKNMNKKNKNAKDYLKSYYYKDNNKSINQIKKKMNLNSYKTISTNNSKKQINRNQYNINNNLNYNTIRNTNNTKTNLHTSLEEKEIKELQECTFKPKINTSNQKGKRTFSQNDINSSLVLANNLSSNNKIKREEEIQLRFEKLYKDNEKYKLSKELKVKERERMISLKAPFIPNIKKKLKKASSYYNKRLKSEGNFENFEERQKKYLNKKNKRSAEIKNRVDSEYEELCSFNPKITNDKGEYYLITKKEKIKTKPVHIRLYEDGKDRKNLQMKKESEKMSQIMDLSNILNPQKNFNFDTINRLYENREQKDEMIKTKKKVEKDEGVTFKPYISENSYLMGVSGNYYERSKKLLNDRESYYEKENKKYIEELRKRAKKKTYTKEERKQVINNIINRLYNDSIYSNKKSGKDEKDKDNDNIKEENIKNFKSYLEC